VASHGEYKFNTKKIIKNLEENMKKIIVNGAKGRMGQMACEVLSHHKLFSLVAKATREDSLQALIDQHQADIVVDLTDANAVFNNAKTIIACGAHPIIGASGLLSHDIQLLEQEASKKKLGGLIIPNFSIGAILMMKTAAQIRGYFERAEIIEMHHDKKLDSPSGTALKTAEMMQGHESAPLPSKEIIEGARGSLHYGTPIHSIRLPGVFAHQEVLLANKDECLTLRHDTLSRSAFAPGLLLACEKVSELKTLLVGLEHVLQ
jgi:4-hydroxy-tetrahydrodipicolinate reductase